MSHGRFLLKFSCSSIVGKTTQKSHFQFIQTLLLDFSGVVNDSLDVLFAVKVFPFECVFTLSIEVVVLKLTPIMDFETFSPEIYLLERVRRPNDKTCNPNILTERDKSFVGSARSCGEFESVSANRLRTTTL